MFSWIGINRLVQPAMDAQISLLITVQPKTLHRNSALNRPFTNGSEDFATASQERTGLAEIDRQQLHH